MTPPDSGDLQHECRCGYHIVGRDAEGAHTWSKCKPDSGEREVCKHGGPGGDCAVCVAEREYSVSLPLSLAQRILAALEGNGNAALRKALADELRAIVERKPDTRKEPQ